LSTYFVIAPKVNNKKETGRQHSQRRRHWRYSTGHFKRFSNIYQTISRKTKSTLFKSNYMGARPGDRWWRL